MCNRQLLRGSLRIEQNPESILSLDNLKLLRNKLLKYSEANILEAYPLQEVRLMFASLINTLPDNIFLNGPFFDRIVIINNGGDNQAIISLGSPIFKHNLLKKYPEIEIYCGTDFTALVKIPKHVMHRLTRPLVALVGLCHPEVFPLPRFHLAISDLAAALRHEFIGEAILLDMQLGLDLKDIVDKINFIKADIIGISASFGQQDLLENLLNKFVNSKEEKTIVVGGSLPALNHKELLHKYPTILVSTSYGEKTIVGIVEYWYGLRPLSSIPFLHQKLDFSYFDKSNLHVSKIDSHSLYYSITLPPELDLLNQTLECKGVMQIELSRGCNFSCSFCPRSHKSRWVDGELEVFDHMLPVLDRLYRKFPKTARRLYLIDEEFVGYGRETTKRVWRVSQYFSRYDFRFEAMARVDQIYKKKRNPSWLASRISMWRQLHTDSLDRVLYGIESGVDSVLKRFNKNISSDEVINAIRLLTLCGLPLRLTYITFDPLMNFNELIATYKFQGRKDLLMNACSNLAAQELASLLDDNTFIAHQSQQQPLYKEIPYMLVTLECLLGSPYLSRVESLGLAGKINLAMGKNEARFLDSRIEMLSRISQLWIDRNFSLDYTLKSILKLCARDTRFKVAFLRELLKDAAYNLLGQMLYIITGHKDLLMFEKLTLDRQILNSLRENWTNASSEEEQLRVLLNIRDQYFKNVVKEIQNRFCALKEDLSEDINLLILKELDVWQSKHEWRLING